MSKLLKPGLMKLLSRTEYFDKVDIGTRYLITGRPIERIDVSTRVLRPAPGHTKSGITLTPLSI